MNENDSLSIKFQWQVGDLRPIETYWIGLINGPWRQIILIVSRFIALGLVYFLCYLLLPEANLLTSLIIAIAASYTLWVSWGISRIGMRILEKSTAGPDWQVGTIRVLISRDGVRWADDLSETYTSWLAITDVEQPDGSIWLKTGKASGIFIPSRILQNSEDRQLVLEKIRGFRSAPSAPSHLLGSSEFPLVRH